MNKYVSTNLKKIHLSVTGFEPAISWFVAKRVIRCATRMCYYKVMKAKFVFTCYTSRFGAILGALLYAG